MTFYLRTVLHLLSSTVQAPRCGQGASTGLQALLETELGLGAMGFLPHI